MSISDFSLVKRRFLAVNNKFQLRVGSLLFFNRFVYNYYFVQYLCNLMMRRGLKRKLFKKVFFSFWKLKEFIIYNPLLIWYFPFSKVFVRRYFFFRIVYYKFNKFFLKKSGRFVKSVLFTHSKNFIFFLWLRGGNFKLRLLNFFSSLVLILEFFSVWVNLQYFFYFSIFKFLVVLFFKFLGVLFFKFEGILLALKFLFYHILVLYYNFFLNMMVLADSVIFKNVVFISFVKKIKILLVSKNKYLLYFLDRYKSWGFLLYDKNSKSGSISYKFAVNWSVLNLKVRFKKFFNFFYLKRVLLSYFSLISEVVFFNEYRVRRLIVEKKDNILYFFKLSWLYDVNLVGNEGDRPVIFIVKYYFNVHFIDLLSDVLELVKPAYNKVQKRKKFLFSVELQDWGESENSYANFLIERRSFCFFGNVLRSMGGQFLEDFCNIVFGKNFVLYEKLLEEDLREQIQGKFVMSHYRW